MQSSIKSARKSAGKLAGTIAALLGLLYSGGAALAQAPAAQKLVVDTAKSSAVYHLVHKMHKIDGKSQAIEGRAAISETGAAQVGVRIKVETFDSGNSNRDAHMKETVQAATYPYVELKAVGQVQKPAQLPATTTQNFRGELTFHGVKKQLEVPVTLTHEAGGNIHAVAKLTISLDEFKIERPSLLFVKVDDALQVDVDLVFKAQ
jgi:polyisoprenoid-binding protein YceI